MITETLIESAADTTMPNMGSKMPNMGSNMVPDITPEVMAETIPGRFRVCITDRSIHEAAMELSGRLTEGGEPLLILDACGCFQPSRISRCAPHSAGLLHIVRASTSLPIPETLDEIWSKYHAIQRDLQARQIFVVGVLDRLYEPEILTRDASRTLGGIKSRLEQLAKDGFDVTVLCENQTGNLGTRSHFLSSLCASADQVSGTSVLH
jgi:hypothetical protein